MKVQAWNHTRTGFYVACVAYCLFCRWRIDRLHSLQPGEGVCIAKGKTQHHTGIRAAAEVTATDMAMLNSDLGRLLVSKGWFCQSLYNFQTFDCLFSTWCCARRGRPHVSPSQLLSPPLRCSALFLHFCHSKYLAKHSKS